MIESHILYLVLCRSDTTIGMLLLGLGLLALTYIQTWRYRAL